MSPFEDRTEAALSRRGLLLGATGLAGAALAAGCSGHHSESGGKDDPQPSAVAGFPVTVAGQAGTARLTKPPRRVVSVGYLRDTDLAIALGAPLVGAVKSTNFPSTGLAPWQHPNTEPQLLDGADGLPLEKIAALHPDVILASDDFNLAKDYASLAKIAPTLSYQAGPGHDDWPVMTDRVGQVLGRRQQAAELVQSVRDKIKKVRAAHPQLAGRTVSTAAAITATDLYPALKLDPASVYALLGLKLAPKVHALPVTTDSGKTKISLEQLPVLDADIMIITYPNPADRARLEHNPLFRQLPAVRRGSYVAVEPDVALAIGFPSPLSIPYGLDKLAAKLAAVIDATKTT